MDYIAGVPFREMARRANIGLATVFADVEAIRGWWRAEHSAERDDKIALELARIDAELPKIDATERMADDGWERSCKDAEELHVRTEGDGSKDADGKAKIDKSISERRSKGQAGDPQFLRIRNECVARRTALIDMRLKIIGGYAPAKMEHAGQGGGPIRVVVVTSEELAAARVAAQQAEQALGERGVTPPALPLP